MNLYDPVLDPTGPVTQKRGPTRPDPAVPRDRPGRVVRDGRGPATVEGRTGAVPRPSRGAAQGSLAVRARGIVMARPPRTIESSTRRCSYRTRSLADTAARRGPTTATTAGFCAPPCAKPADEGGLWRTQTRLPVSRIVMPQFAQPRRIWLLQRRGWDSNPRMTLTANAGFQDRCDAVVVCTGCPILRYHPPQPLRASCCTTARWLLHRIRREANRGVESQPIGAADRPRSDCRGSVRDERRPLSSAPGGRLSRGSER